MIIAYDPSSNVGSYLLVHNSGLLLAWESSVGSEDCGLIVDIRTNDRNHKLNGIDRLDRLLVILSLHFLVPGRKLG